MRLWGWITDKARLALRKRLPKLIAFACMPTRKEFDQLASRLLSRAAEEIFRGVETDLQHRKSLH